jgi:hypothetical protein
LIITAIGAFSARLSLTQFFDHAAACRPFNMDLEDILLVDMTTNPAKGGRPDSPTQQRWSSMGLSTRIQVSRRGFGDAISALFV